MDIYQLPPLYPSVLNRPLKLDTNAEYEDLYDLKKSLRDEMKNSFYFIENNNVHIERYSDRYSKIKKADINKWQPDWIRLPSELKYFYEKDDKKVKKRKAIAPTLVAKKKLSKNKLDINLLLRLEGDEEMNENDENDEMDEDGIKKEKKSEKGSDAEDENQEDMENAEDEDIDDDDYGKDYFDNGENYEEDDGGDGDNEPAF